MEWRETETETYTVSGANLASNITVTNYVITHLFTFAATQAFWTLVKKIMKQINLSASLHKWNSNGLLWILVVEFWKVAYILL